MGCGMLDGMQAGMWGGMQDGMQAGMRDASGGAEQRAIVCGRAPSAAAPALAASPEGQVFPRCPRNGSLFPRQRRQSPLSRWHPPGRQGPALLPAATALLLATGATKLVAGRVIKVPVPWVAPPDVAGVICVWVCVHHVLGVCAGVGVCSRCHVCACVCVHVHQLSGVCRCQHMHRRAHVCRRVDTRCHVCVPVHVHCVSSACRYVCTMCHGCVGVGVCTSWHMCVAVCTVSRVCGCQHGYRLSRVCWRVYTTCHVCAGVCAWGITCVQVSVHRLSCA